MLYVHNSDFPALNEKTVFIADGNENVRKRTIINTHPSVCYITTVKVLLYCLLRYAGPPKGVKKHETSIHII